MWFSIKNEKKKKKRKIYLKENMKLGCWMLSGDENYGDFWSYQTQPVKLQLQANQIVLEIIYLPFSLRSTLCRSQG